MPSPTALRPGEVPIDAEQVRRLVAAQFPQWADLPIRPVERSGVDNATYRLGDALSVRLPRLPRWVGQVEREQRWLPVLAPALPLPVPLPVARGAPGEGYPFPWSVYGWIEGDRATPEGLTDERRTAADLAGFLGALQAIDPTGGPPPEASNGFRGAAPADPRDSPIVASRVRDRLSALDGLADTEGLAAVWEAALAAPEWDRPPVWLHGDPAPGNLLSRRGRLSAVIDFGTLAVGDPACDLIAAWAWLSAAGRDALRAALAVDDATWARGRLWGLTTLPAPEVFADPARRAAARSHVDALVTDLRGR